MGLSWRVPEKNKNKIKYNNSKKITVWYIFIAGYLHDLQVVLCSLEQLGWLHIMLVGCRVKSK